MKPIKFRGKETMSYNKTEQPRPPAEGAEEILTAGEFIREKIRQKLEIKGEMKGLWAYGCNGEDALRWSHEFAALHAQKIADKMVSERLREELIRWEEYCDDLIPNMPVASDEKEVTIAMIDLYLNNRSI